MAVALVTTAGAGFAEAASITQTLNYDFGNDHQTIVVGPNGSTTAFNTQISRTLNFDQFDTALGDLESVSFSFGAGGTRIMGVTHNNGGDGSITVNITNQVGFSLGDDLVVGSALMGLQRTLGLGDFIGQLYVGGSQNLNIVSDLNKTALLDAVDFGDFIGAGTLPLLIYSRDIFESLSVTGDGLIATAIAGSCDPNCGNFSWAGPISGTASLTYSFKPLAQVPEPASLMLLGGGLAGFALVHRRRRTA